MVGGHVAALPERTLDEEACDFVARDEGLHTIVDLLEALRAGDTRPAAKCPGWGIATSGHCGSPPNAGGAARHGPRRRDARHRVGPAADGRVPRAQLALLRPSASASRTPRIYTTLGCPYHCSFCCIQAPFKGGERRSGSKQTVNSYRFWSPERVIEEIDLLVNKYGVRNIKFADEMFVLNQRHVLGICDLIIERGYDLNIWAYARVDTVKDGMLDKLKRAGFNWLALGIEAADDRVLTDVDKSYEDERGLRHRRAGSRRPASTSSATTSSACPRTRSRRCSRRWTWRSS